MRASKTSSAYPQARLLLDANDGFTVDGFIDYLRRVEETDLYWIEEPFAETRDGLERLVDWRRASGQRFLIADGELQPDVPLVRSFAADGLIDVLLMDVVGFGFTPWRRVAQHDDERSFYSPHAWGSPLRTIYAAHLSAGYGRVAALEGVRGITEGVDARGYQPVDGVVTVPDAPGFGLAIPGA